jgi:hypothetical protein
MSRLLSGASALGIVLITLPVFASAPAHRGTLLPDTCHVREFEGGGSFTAAVTHSHRSNDVYQIVCEPGGDVCWAFSFNIGNGGTTLTTGLTDDLWEWWVCAWADNSGRTKYQAIASGPGVDVGRVGARFGTPRLVDLGAAGVPAGVGAMTRRLQEHHRR